MFCNKDNNVLRRISLAFRNRGATLNFQVSEKGHEKFNIILTISDIY